MKTFYKDNKSFMVYIVLFYTFKTFLPLWKNFSITQDYSIQIDDDPKNWIFWNNFGL